MQFSQIMTDAVFYWERKRIVYNLILAILALACWGQDIFGGGLQHMVGGLIVLLVFAMIANFLFSLAYAVDIAFQVTPLRERWRRVRWMLFLSGTAIASTLALWVMLDQGMA